MNPTITLMAEYGTFPLWLDDGVATDPVEPRELPISDALARRIERWAAALDATLDRDDPRSSAFPSPTAKQEFIAEGEEIALQLACELAGAYDIYYVERGRAGSRRIELRSN